MYRYISVVLCTLYLVLVVSVPLVHADWTCREVPVGPGDRAYRCVEDSTLVPGTPYFQTLRECLRGAPFALNEEVDVNVNKCVNDPRFVMRNFAALNFWSVGKAVNLALPLATLGAAGLCLVFLLAGAYTYIISAGDAKKVGESVNRMVYSVLGLVLVILSYAIVRTILYMTQVNTFGL